MEFGPSFWPDVGRGGASKGRDVLRGLVNERLKKLGPGKGILFAIDEAQSASIEELAALAVLYQQVLGDQDATGLSDSDQRGLALVLAGLPSMVDDLLEEPSVTFFCGVLSSVRWGRYLCPRCAIHISRRSKTLVFTLTRRRRTLRHTRAWGIPIWFSWWAITCGALPSGGGSQVIERCDVENGHADAVSEFYEAVDAAPVLWIAQSATPLYRGHGC